jgi:hypothetical protein
MMYGGWSWEKHMSEPRPAETISCSEYHRLFDACASAREVLNEQRAEIFRSPSAEEAMVDEVLRSQVKYAQAYQLLRNHVLGCFTCQLDVSIA